MNPTFIALHQFFERQTIERGYANGIGLPRNWFRTRNLFYSIWSVEPIAKCALTKTSQII